MSSEAAWWLLNKCRIRYILLNRYPPEMLRPLF